MLRSHNINFIVNCTYLRDFTTLHHNTFLFTRKKFSKFSTYISKNVKFKTLNSTHIQIYTCICLAHVKSGFSEPQRNWFCGLCCIECCCLEIWGQWNPKIVLYFCSARLRRKYTPMTILAS